MKTSQEIQSNIKDKLCLEQMNLKNIVSNPQYKAGNEYYSIWSTEVPKRIDHLTWVTYELLNEYLDADWIKYYNAMLSEIDF